MALLEVETEKRDGGARVTLTGELDISTAARLEEAIGGLDAAWPGLVVIDLRELQFIDSTGLRLILRARARAYEHGGRLALVRGPDQVQRVFEMTRLEEQLEIVDDPCAVG